MSIATELHYCHFNGVEEKITGISLAFASEKSRKKAMKLIKAIIPLHDGRTKK